MRLAQEISMVSRDAADPWWSKKNTVPNQKDPIVMMVEPPETGLLFDPEVNRFE